jgi:acetyl esterase/lipase
VHGGAWIGANRETSVEPLFEPLSKAGFAWFTISYRLAQDASQFGAAIDDVEQAVRFVRAHTAQYDVDPNRVALIGESAGARLASMAALSPGRKGDVRAVVAFYGPSDLVSLAETSDMVPPPLRRAVAGTPWAQYLLSGLKRLSPLYNVRANMPPFLLIHGTADRLVPFSQSTAMCERMKSVGASCELFAVQGGGHGMRWWQAVHLTAYKRIMVEWLEKQLAPARRQARA